MIKVNPKNDEDLYEIIWEPVKNVNHGLVLYTVKVLKKKDNKVDSFVSINFNLIYFNRISMYNIF